MQQILNCAVQLTGAALLIFQSPEQPDTPPLLKVLQGTKCQKFEPRQQ